MPERELVEVFQWNIPALQNWMRDKWDNAGTLWAFHAVLEAVNNLDNSLAEWSNALPESVKEAMWLHYLPDYVSHTARLTNIAMVVNASLETELPLDNPLNNALAFGPMFYGAMPNLQGDGFVLDTNTGQYHIAPHITEAMGLGPDNPFTDIPFDVEHWGRAQPGMAEWVYAFSLANRAAMAGASPENWLIEFGEFLNESFTAAVNAMPEGMREGAADLIGAWAEAAGRAASSTYDAMGDFGKAIGEGLRGGALYLLGAAALALGLVIALRK